VQLLAFSPKKARHLKPRGLIILSKKTHLKQAGFLAITKGGRAPVHQHKEVFVENDFHVR